MLFLAGMLVEDLFSDLCLGGSWMSDKTSELSSFVAGRRWRLTVWQSSRTSDCVSSVLVCDVLPCRSFFFLETRANLVPFQTPVPSPLSTTMAPLPWPSTARSITTVSSGRD